MDAKAQRVPHFGLVRCQPDDLGGSGAALVGHRSRREGGFCPQVGRHERERVRNKMRLPYSTRSILYTLYPVTCYTLYPVTCSLFPRHPSRMYLYDSAYSISDAPGKCFIRASAAISRAQRVSMVRKSQSPI